LLHNGIGKLNFYFYYESVRHSKPFFRKQTAANKHGKPVY